MELEEVLRGKRVLVTGASSGIGLATCHRLADAGARLALVARGESVVQAAREARDRGAVAHPVRADVTDRAALERAIARVVDAMDGLDAAVVNAGGAAYGHFDETPAEDFDRAVALTFGGAVDTVRCVLPHLERSNGTLVVVSSVAAWSPLPLMSGYVAAKHALRGFVGSLRAELRATGSRVRVCEVEPGPVASPFWDHVTSAGAGVPPRLPGSYSAETVAEAVVSVVARPRRRVTIGFAMGTVLNVIAVVAPVSLERVLAIGDRLVRRRERRAEGPGVLRAPTDGGRTRGGVAARPSVRSTLMKLRG